MKIIVENAFNGRKILYNNLCWRFPRCNMKSWSIVFFGSDHYSLLSLKALHEQMKHDLIRSLEVVVINERSIVYNYAVSNNINHHFWPPHLNGIYDFGVIVSFGKLIPQNVIEQFPLGIINVHGSLLPKYRGGMPIAHAIKNGETVTGVTISRIKPDKFDTGDIILQKSCCIGENELMPSLYRRLTHLGCECLLEVIRTIPECFKCCTSQPKDGISYAPKLTKESAVVKWNDMTALEIFNLHRALFGIFELRSTWQNQSVKFLCLSLPSSKKDTKLDPGGFMYDKKLKFLYVQCKDNQIAICSMKFKKKLYKACDFYSGYLNKTPGHLWKFES